MKSKLKLIKHLGSGFFGDVHLGYDVLHGDVAVKVLKQAPGESDADWALRKQSLIREGQLLLQAAHDNVVKVHHIVESDIADAVLLVMELCPGGSLQQAFEAGPLPLGDVRRFATGMCLGLDALHRRGMLHRDIKPGNTLLSANNVAQIADFGLVTDSLILGYGSQAGYADHLAPEIWNRGPTSMRSDIWALGMTLYRLIHGAEWYSRLPADFAETIRHGGFAAKLPWLPHVPNTWRRVIRKMMHDDTPLRYQDAHEVMNALAGLSSEPNWSCVVAADEIRWTTEVNGRRRVVVLRVHSPRKHKWKAWTEPLAGGRRHRLGGSGGRINSSEAERQLREFFSR